MHMYVVDIIRPSESVGASRVSSRQCFVVENNLTHKHALSPFVSRRDDIEAGPLNFYGKLHASRASRGPTNGASRCAPVRGEMGRK